MNLEEVEMDFDMYFDMFQLGKKYTMTFYDFLNPEEKTILRYKNGSERTYLVWKVRCNSDYEEEGIPKNIDFFQQLSKSSFIRAYHKYRLNDKTFRNFVYENKNEVFAVDMTFERENRKRMKIHKIELPLD